MDILRELQSRAEQAEVMAVRSETTTVEFESNRFKTSRVEETSGTAVRVMCGGRLGFSASTDEQATDRLVRNALESAAFGDEVPLFFPAPQSAAPVNTFDPAIAELPVARLVEIGQQVVDLILAVEPGAQVNVSLKRGIQHTAIRNQAGTEAVFRRSPLAISYEITRVQGDDVLILFEITGTTAWEDDVLAPARRLAAKLEQARTVVPLSSGKLPVLFAPSGVTVLGLPLMEGINGKNVFTGISPLAGKIGEKLFDDKVTFIDDGTIDGRFGSAPYDDEGVPHRRNVLIDHGVLRSFVYDLNTAARSGTQSTGNGRRELFETARPEPTNLIMAAGDTPLADIMAGIDHGLLVEDVLGLGQGNIISGAFSNPLALAYRIEKGQIVGRVKDASIAGNVYELLQNVAAVSRETLWVYQNLSSPYVLLPEMNVISKE